MNSFVWNLKMVAERLYDAVRWIQGRYVFSSESFKVKVEAFKFDEMYACGFTQMTIDQLCEASQWVQDLCGCKSLGSQATVETSKIVTMSMCELSLWLQNHCAKQFNGCKHMWMLFLRLPSHMFYLLAFPNGSEQLHEAFQWNQNRCGYCS